jgi:hypothetical protein
MGLKCSLDIAQAAMEYVLSDIEDANVNIDDSGAFSSDWDHQVTLLAPILSHLCKNGFTNNPLKCKWAIKETDRLGCWLGKRRSTPYYIWVILTTLRNYACSLVA